MTTLNNAFDRILVISLPRSRRRREHIREEFQKAGIENYELVDAIDGGELPIDNWRRAGFVLPDTMKHHPLTPGQVGCALSHALTYCLMLSRGYSSVLVCEDDIVLSPGCHETLEQAMVQMPADWDIIHFFSSRSDHHPFSRRRRQITENVYTGFNEGATSACYAVTRRCAHYLLSLRFPINTTSDGIANWPTGWWTSGYNGYVVKPYLCSQGLAVPSDIGERPG